MQRGVVTFVGVLSILFLSLLDFDFESNGMLYSRRHLHSNEQAVTQKKPEGRPGHRGGWDSMPFPSFSVTC